MEIRSLEVNGQVVLIRKSDGKSQSNNTHSNPQKAVVEKQDLGKV